MNQTVKEKELAKKMQKELAEVQARLTAERKNLSEIDAKIAAADLELKKHNEQLDDFFPAKKAGILKAIALGDGDRGHLERLRMEIAAIEVAEEDNRAIREILQAEREKIAKRIEMHDVTIAATRRQFLDDLYAGLSAELRDAGRETIIKMIAIRNLTGQPWAMEDLLFRTFFPDGYHIAEFQNAAEGLRETYGG